MTGTTFFFILLGVTAAVAGLMKLVEWLDAPHTAPRRAERPASRARETSAVELPCAELSLERARRAA